MRATAPYRRESPRVRAHVALRWLSCPFSVVLNEIPVGATVLDYGCGHGLLALRAAEARAARVLGVDIDPDKIGVARRAAVGATTFGVVEAGEVPPGSWEVVCVTDVLYLLAPDDQRELVVRLASRLAPGGALLVKEMDTRPRLKAAWMRAQERVMVSVLGATRGATLAFTDPDHLADAMRGAGLDVTARPAGRWYPWPHHLLVGRAPR